MPVAPWWEEFGSSASAETPPAAADPAGAPAATPDVRVHRAPRRRPRGLLALQLSAAVLGVALVALVAVLALRSGGSPGAGPTAAPAPGTSAPVTSPPGTADSGPPSTGGASGPAATDDAAALRELQALRAQGLAAHPPRGQWAAQLAAKSIGTTDPAQVAANGSHTFYAGDILVQSRRIAAGPAGADVFVLRSDDYGKGSVDARGNPYWTTLAAGPFASAADVRTWCDSVFGDVPAATRGNACLPRQLLPVR